MYNGEIYASRAEASFAARLDMLRKAMGSACVSSVERQPRFPLNVNGYCVAVYTADFRVTLANGDVIIYEVKGHWTDRDKLRWRMFRALYPEVDARVIERWREVPGPALKLAK